MRLIDLLPFLITFAFVLLIVAGLFVARKYGKATAYLVFNWVIPLVSVVWWQWGEEQLGFGYSLLNPFFVFGIVFVSFAVGIVCLPPILYLNWRRLSALNLGALLFSGLLHASAFLLYVWISLSVFIHGK
jgi:hypothetical protein